ncbi:MAG TPA: hypothetical protein VGC77_13120 [Rhodopseudomonas sp.]|uniref:hypothetical protein n=1 Tax=Rhodopseudomonas sp. TaxID=1078 RepID=UPI002ED82EF6
MKRVATTYLSSEEIQQIASEQLKEAEALPDGPARDEVMRAAQTLSNLADMKRWLSSKELQAPQLSTAPPQRRR